MENTSTEFQSRIVTSDINENEWNKIKNDLRFINLISDSMRNEGCRLIVSGGYATDGNAGKITRPHRDIDLQIFGNASDYPKLIHSIVDDIKQSETILSGITLKDKGRQEYYHAYFAEGNGVGADIYYIQVEKDPFADTKVVIKNDGTKSPEHSFNAHMVNLEGVTFEAVSPEEKLNDILMKRNRGDKYKPEHDQDINNLKLLIENQPSLRVPSATQPF